MGLLLAATVIPGILFETAVSLVVAVLVMSLLNVFIRPVLLLLTLPFIILTMGLGIVVINALLFMLTAALVPGFSVSGFGAAFLGALVAGVAMLVYRTFLPPTYREGVVRVRRVRQEDGPPRRRGPGGRRGPPDDVIDI